MESTEPLKEAKELVKESGGEAFRLCYQCGLCTVSCPWNQVRTFLPHKLITQSKFGLVELGEEDWWICTTCNTCVSRCPRGVGITEIMQSVRRITLEYDYGSAPESLRSAIGSLTGSGNPWGGSREGRTDWTEGEAVPRYGEESEVLYFSCCVPAFDRKMENVAKATARILRETGARFGILGSRESCCGESIGKAGNHETFESLARRNIDAFRESGVEEIVVSSPHCYTTFRTEYVDLGGAFRVRHITQYLSDLLDRDELLIRGDYGKRVVYHDPCYLGRHSGIYDEPRNVLSRIPGLELLDELKSREESVCCGGGGGRMWMETKKGERFTDLLVEEAAEQGADVIATACPYCMLNFKDSVLTMDREGLEVLDVCEIVNEVI